MQGFRFVPVLATLSACVTCPAVAAEDGAGQAANAPVLSIKPVILDTDKADSTTLGLDYAFDKKIKLLSPGRTGAGQDIITAGQEDVVVTTAELDLLARGTLTTSSARTSNKLLDFSARPFFVVDALPAFFKVGGFLTYESDQSRENRQKAYGIASSLAKMNVLGQGDGASILVNYGQVDPNADPERKQLLSTLDKYRRWNAEFTYEIPIRSPQMHSIEFNYRHYQEVAPPAAVKTAGMDVNRLGLIRLNLANDFFFQYSAGKLPFDQRSIRTVKLGWSLKLF